MKQIFIFFMILFAMAFCLQGVISVAANIRTAPTSKAEIAVDSITVEVIDDYSTYYMVMFVAGTDHANDGVTYRIWSKPTEEEDGKFFVTGKGVTLRDKDGNKTGKTAKPNAEFKIIKKLIEWYKIKMPNGTEGWVYKNTISIIE